MKEILSYILLCILCYIIGSIPTAFFIVKSKFKKDITNEGSGNVGARNAYDVTKSKYIGLLVFLIDYLKGFIPTLLLIVIFSAYPIFILIPCLLLVIGHNFSIFLKFQGGRGLATAAGIISVINFWFVVFWCILFLIFNKIFRNIHLANTGATLLLPVVLVFSYNFVVKYNINSSIFNEVKNFELLFALISSICFCILLKHIDPVIKILKLKIKNK